MKNELKIIVEEKIVRQLEFHHSRAVTGPSGGEEGEPLACNSKAKGVGIPSPCFSLLCISGINAYPRRAIAVPLFVEQHTYLVRIEGERKLCQQLRGATRFLFLISLRVCL